jgi:hypothetical protein
MMLNEFISDNVRAGHLPNTGLQTFRGSASLSMAQLQIPVAAPRRAVSGVGLEPLASWDLGSNPAEGMDVSVYCV